MLRAEQTVFIVRGCYCVRRVFTKARALRWTCGYGGQSIALDVCLWRSEHCVGRVVMEVRGAYFQPAFRPVLPKVAIGIPALLTVVAGG